jgi:cathepsin B
MMKAVGVGVMAAIAGATDLKLSWKDCGDADTKVKITSFGPAAITLGQKATMSGSGALPEDVSDANFDLEMSNSLTHLLTCKGDAKVSKNCSLPLGVGSLTFDAMPFPIKAGTATVNVDIELCAHLPSALASTTTIAKATASNGDKLFCIQITSARAEEEVHPERVAMIAEIQNTPGVLWKAAPHPRFAAEAPGASKTLCGVKGDQKAVIQGALDQGEIKEFQSVVSAAIPDNFDSKTHWPQCAKIIGDIRDQSNCGCCWAFAGAEAASDRMCIATNASIMVPLSAQDVCFNGGGFMSQGFTGGQITSPWSYIKKGGFFGGKGAVSGGQYQGSGPFGKGLCSDYSLPHCHHHGPQGSDPYPAEGAPGCPHENSPAGPKTCDSDAVAPHNDFAKDKYSYTGNTVTARGVADIQQAIMAGGPMEVAFTVYADFENYASGIYHHVSGGQVGGHAVKVVGWGVDSGTQYWKIANSWNPYWGEKGYFRIKFGEGGIDAQAVGSDPTAKWSRAGDAEQSIVV